MSYKDGMLKDDALKGKTVLITGGGTGLGKSMTKYFLQLGANVVITSRKLDVLQKTADELMKLVPLTLQLNLTRLFAILLFVSTSCKH